MREIAHFLEFIKYFTLIGSKIIHSTNINGDKIEKLKDYHTIEMPNDLSFTFKSILIDFGTYYSSLLNKKEQKIKYSNSVIDNSGNFQIITNPCGLMTPTITDEYIIDGYTYKRYVFLSDSHETYLFAYESYNQWFNRFSSDSSSLLFENSMVVLIDINDSYSISQFNQFMNMNLNDWREGFTTAKNLAITGEFLSFSLYDPRIYEYELSYLDRKSIISFMVFSLNWNLIFENIDGTNGVNEYELFTSLINNINDNDCVSFYSYMFTMNTQENKLNLSLYQEKLPPTLFDRLMVSLIKGFYKSNDISFLKNNFNLSKLYPIGYEEKNIRTDYYNLDTHESGQLIVQKIGLKYDIDLITNSNPFHIKINSAIQYKYIFQNKRIEYRNLPYHQQSNTNEIVYSLDEVIYITPFKLANQSFKGFDLNVGCVIPVPAFVLPWIVDINESIYGLEDLIRDYVNAAGLIFPFFKIVQFAELVEIIGFGLGIVGTILDEEGLQNQIELYDNYVTNQNPNGEVSTSAKDFISIYYAISLAFGGIDLSKAIKEASVLRKPKVLFEHENLLAAWGFRDDFNDFISTNHPDQNTQAFNEITNQMDKLEIECKNFKYLKNGN